MLLVIDAGNTNITYAVFEGDKIVGRFRLSTAANRTSDEYAHLTEDLLKIDGISKNFITGVAISSVVPRIMHSMENSIKKAFEIEPVIISHKSNHGLKLGADNPAEMGADRIADAVAAIHYYGFPVIVCDYGTATTYDGINADGVFRAAVTCPGIQISAKSLWLETAKLPDIQIASPGTILATNTVTSMQAGIVYGTVGESEYIINRIKRELGIEMKVVATGGLGRLIAEESDVIDVYDTDLTLQGIRVIFEREISTR